MTAMLLLLPFTWTRDAEPVSSQVGSIASSYEAGLSNIHQRDVAAPTVQARMTWTRYIVDAPIEQDPVARRRDAAPFSSKAGFAVCT